MTLAVATDVDPVAWPALATIAAAMASGILGYLGSRLQHKGKSENTLMTQLQRRMDRMQARLDRVEARDRVYIPHILRLNAHIEADKGPPAPAIPRVIVDYLEAEHHQDRSD